jgi:hypothetical protein
MPRERYQYLRRFARSNISELVQRPLSGFGRIPQSLALVVINDQTFQKQVNWRVVGERIKKRGKGERLERQCL